MNPSAQHRTNSPHPDATSSAPLLADAYANTANGWADAIPRHGAASVPRRGVRRTPACRSQRPQRRANRHHPATSARSPPAGEARHPTPSPHGCHSPQLSGRGSRRYALPLRFPAPRAILPARTNIQSSRSAITSRPVSFASCPSPPRKGRANNEKAEGSGNRDAGKTAPCRRRPSHAERSSPHSIGAHEHFRFCGPLPGVGVRDRGVRRYQRGRGLRLEEPPRESRGGSS
jgi:hypothetical protein